MSTTANPIDRLQELGGELFLQGGFIRYRVPKGNPEAHELLAEIRKDRQAFIALLQDRESKPPSLDEIQASLPPGVKLVNNSCQPDRPSRWPRCPLWRTRGNFMGVSRGLTGAGAKA